MMHKELDNVIVESNISIDYFDEIINYIKSMKKKYKIYLGYLI